MNDSIQEMDQLNDYHMGGLIVLIVYMFTR